MIKNKQKGIVTTEEVREVYGVYHQPGDNIIKETLDDNNVNETDFINLCRSLKSYNDRKYYFEKRGYKVVNDTWLNDHGESFDFDHTDPISFYYSTITVNIKNEIETWVKRKPFNTIKKQLLKSKNICTHNPYNKFVILDNDMKTEHVFYKK